MSFTTEDPSLPDDFSTTMLPNSTTSGQPRDERIITLKIVVLSAIFVMIIIGNSAVLLALVMSKIKLQRMYFFLFHLSIADLITAMFNVFPQLIWEITHQFYGGTFLCKMIKYLQLLGPYLSSFVLCATAIDRYQAICYPLESRSKLHRSSFKVRIAWSLSLLFCSPQLVIFSYREVSKGRFDCWAEFIEPWGERIYVTWYALSSFFIPFTILIFTFSNICIELWRNSRRIRKYELACYGDAEPCPLLNAGNQGNLIQKEAKGAAVAGRDSGASLNGDTLKRSKQHATCRLCVDLRDGAGRTRIARQTRKPRSHSDPSYFSKAKIKTIKLTVVIIICYIVCSSPFNVVQCWARWVPGAENSPYYKGKHEIDSFNQDSPRQLCWN